LPDNPLIFSDFRAIKKIQTAGDNVRFAADRGKNGHADRFWAAALALHAGKDTSEPFSFERVSAADARDESGLAFSHPAALGIGYHGGGCQL